MTRKLAKVVNKSKSYSWYESKVAEQVGAVSSTMIKNGMLDGDEVRELQGVLLSAIYKQAATRFNKRCKGRGWGISKPSYDGYKLGFHAETHHAIVRFEIALVDGGLSVRPRTFKLKDPNEFEFVEHIIYEIQVIKKLFRQTYAQMKGDE